MGKVKLFLYRLCHLIFPSNWLEVGLLFIALIIFGALATDLALNYRIIYDQRIPWDGYFSFDNRSIVLTGGGFERHPLSNYFFDEIRKFALWFSDGKYDADFRLILAYCSVVAVSFTLLQIFKYLRNIVRLSKVVSILLVVFTGMFSTTILLSFTPETYTYTFLILALFNYYAAKKLQDEKKLSGFALTIFAVATGGLTITNIVKVYIPILFENKLFKSWKAFGSAVLRVMISVAVFVLLFLNRLNFDASRIFEKTTEQYEKFSNPKVTPLWDMMMSWFFGGNILFSSFFTRDYHNKKGFDYKAIFMDVYSSIGSYVFVSLLLLLILWAIAKNFKNKFVLILGISFLVDIIIHCVLKFGLHTSYIYGGHFVFIYPLLVGWLLASYNKTKALYKIILGVVLLMMIYLGFNNYYRMEEFYVFLDQYYR